jgi:hypothetical protein
MWDGRMKPSTAPSSNRAALYAALLFGCCPAVLHAQAREEELRVSIRIVNSCHLDTSSQVPSVSCTDYHPLVIHHSDTIEFERLLTSVPAPPGVPAEKMVVFVF